jgi:hypothetical protein
MRPAMGEVTGPISTLPGTRRAPPEGAVCDNHPSRPAVTRLQGETDSFGCEMYDLCAECLNEEKSAGPMTGKCDWCKGADRALRPRRDIDEGMHGPVYYVCKECADRDEENLRRELSYYDNGWGDD